MSNRLHIGAAGTGYGAVTENGLATAAGDVWNYESTDFAVQMYCNAGTIQLRTAPSGTAGNPITFTSRLSISNTGNFTIAAPSSGTTVSTALRTDVVGGILFTSANKGLRFNVNDSTQFMLQAMDGTAASSFQPLFLGGSTTTLGIGTTSYVTVGANGNVTIIAPTAGVGLTQTGFAGSDTALFNGGTSGSFRVTDRGLPYGTSLHNNAGAVTGTTNQYITSGTYTPTLTNVANASTLTAAACQWIRVGNVVSVSGNAAIGTTAAAPTLTQFGISLPIASNFANASLSECAGSGARYTSGTREPCGIVADTTNDRAELSLMSLGTATVTTTFHFSYVIL
jgi:hypothetical protein